MTLTMKIRRVHIRRGWEIYKERKNACNFKWTVQFAPSGKGGGSVTSLLFIRGGLGDLGNCLRTPSNNYIIKILTKIKRN
jgi:hypothetical protein